MEITKELGSNFSVPCGVELGHISRSKEYRVQWQRFISEEAFVTLFSCTYTGSQGTSPTSCSPDLNPDDFSLAIHNFGASGDINLSKLHVKFKCTVDLLFPPSVDHQRSTGVYTTINFHYGKISVATAI